MRMIADAVRGVALQTPPKLRMVHVNNFCATSVGTNALK